MPEPVVAIITRTKDRPILLRRAIDSVLAQHYSDWVHVIVNDGGDPAPVDALLAGYTDAYAGRLVRVDNPQSLGMEAASNRGIAASASRYLIIHDDDDTWHPTCLDRLVGYLEDAPDPAAGAICHSILIRERLEDEAPVILGHEAFNANLLAVPFAQMAVRNLFPPISFLYRRAALEAIGPYREDLPVLGDWDFNLRFLRRYDIGVVPEALAYWHHRVSDSDDGYSNSILGGASQHAYYDAAIRNDLLRADMDKGRVDIGILTNLSTAVTDEIHFTTPASLIEARAAPALRQVIVEARERAQAAEAKAAELALAKQECDAALVREQVLTHQLLDLNARIDALYHSTSWQVSAPLRVLSRLYQRFFRRG